MRPLTFPGFLTRYVVSLSNGNSGSIYALTREAASDNPRLREPLFLYALTTGRMQTLLAASKKTSLHEQYKTLSEQYTCDDVLSMLKEKSPVLPPEYLKVWISYCSEADAHNRDDRVKELMRVKVVNMQAQKHVTTYRICKDLNLNNANINAWLKNGTASKVGLNTARSVLQYVENR